MKAAGRVLGKAGRAAEWSIGRIAVHEVARSCVGQRFVERRAFESHGLRRECTRHTPDVLGIADARLDVPAGRNVETALPVQPKQSVVARPVQVDQHRRERRRIGRLPVRPQRGARRIEARITHVVVTGCAPCPVFGTERSQRLDHGIRVVAYDTVTANQIWIHVRQADSPALEPARGVQIEEDGTTANERLDIPIEVRGVVLAQHWQELPLPAGPFQKGAPRRDQ